MNLCETATQLKNGQASLGIELGSTRIKAVLINPDFETISSGSYTWENQLKDGIWTKFGKEFKLLMPRLKQMSKVSTM